MSPSKAAGFMNLRNSQNKSLQQKSAGVLSPLTNNASIGDISGSAYAPAQSNIPKIPGLQPAGGGTNSGNNNNISGLNGGLNISNFEYGGGKDSVGGSVFNSGKNSVIKRDSIVFKSPGGPTGESSTGGANNSSSNYRNNQAGIQNSLPTNINAQHTPLRGAGSSQNKWNGTDLNQAPDSGVYGTAGGSSGGGNNFLRSSNPSFSSAVDNFG